MVEGAGAGARAGGEDEACRPPQIQFTHKAVWTSELGGNIGAWDDGAILHGSLGTL